MRNELRKAHSPGFLRGLQPQRSPPTMARGGQKNRKYTEPSNYRTIPKTNWFQIRWEDSHGVTHTSSEQTGGLTELPKLKQDEKPQHWWGRTVLWAGGGVGVEGTQWNKRQTLQLAWRCNSRKRKMWPYQRLGQSRPRQWDLWERREWRRGEPGRMCPPETVLKTQLGSLETLFLHEIQGSEPAPALGLTLNRSRASQVAQW